MGWFSGRVGARVSTRRASVASKPRGVTRVGLFRPQRAGRGNAGYTRIRCAPTLRPLVGGSAGSPAAPPLRFGRARLRSRFNSDRADLGGELRPRGLGSRAWRARVLTSIESEFEIKEAARAGFLGTYHGRALYLPREIFVDVVCAPAVAASSLVTCHISAVEFCASPSLP